VAIAKSIISSAAITGLASYWSGRMPFKFRHRTKRMTREEAIAVAIPVQKIANFRLSERARDFSIQNRSRFDLSIFSIFALFRDSELVQKTDSLSELKKRRLDALLRGLVSLFVEFSEDQYCGDYCS
jgi:hypothetical protein